MKFFEKTWKLFSKNNSIVKRRIKFLNNKKRKFLVVKKIKKKEFSGYILEYKEIQSI